LSAELGPQASAGALERMDVYACTSMPRTLTQAAEAGWHVIGAEHSISSCSKLRACAAGLAEGLWVQPRSGAGGSAAS